MNDVSDGTESDAFELAMQRYQEAKEFRKNKEAELAEIESWIDDAVEKASSAIRARIKQAFGSVSDDLPEQFITSIRDGILDLPVVKEVFEKENRDLAEARDAERSAKSSVYDVASVGRDTT